jgi:hypothetical protein
MQKEEEEEKELEKKKRENHLQLKPEDTPDQALRV